MVFSRKALFQSFFVEESKNDENGLKNLEFCVDVFAKVVGRPFTDIYTISPGSWGSMAKSRPATAARGPQARGLPWRAEMQPNCPGYQERLCLSSWNRYSTRTGKARKNRTRKESFLARKNDRNFQPCEIANIRPRAEICNLTWLESADSVLAKQVPVQSSKVHVRSQNLATFIRRSDLSVPWLQTCDI